MKIPRQTKNAYELDFASFKILARLCARSRTLMKRPVQTKMRYDPDFGSFDLSKTVCVINEDKLLPRPGNSSDQLKFIIETLTFDKNLKANFVFNGVVI